MTDTTAKFRQLQQIIRSSPHAAGDADTLLAHSQPAPGVHVDGIPQRCNTCNEPMPCRTVKRLAADYQFTELMHVTEPGSVASETGVVGPTGARMRDHDAGGS